MKKSRLRRLLPSGRNCRRAVDALDRRSLRFESLEARRLLAITVDTLVDELDGSIVDGDISLRDAIALAPPGETIDFSVSGKIDLSPQFQHLTIDKPLSIDGGGLITIDAGGGSNGSNYRVFIIDDGDNSSESEVNLSGLTLKGGKPAGQDQNLSRGGAIFNREKLYLNRSKLTENMATVGGAMLNFGTATISESNISENRAILGGGGVFNSATLNVVSSTISGNISSSKGGGGIFNYASSTFSVLGIANITESTISKNRVEGGSQGGGVFSQGVLNIDRSTVANNNAPGGGGGINVLTVLRNSALHVSNSIIADNTASPIFSEVASDLQVELVATLTFNFNLLGDASYSGIQSTTGIGNLLDVDPLVGPLADNGGPTQTHALLPGSPAIDVGDPAVIFDPAEYDQRGTPFARVATGIVSGVPTNRIDIGAYEAQRPPLADFVDDDSINGADFLAWQRGFGMTDVAMQVDGDSDYDGDVDVSDLAAWRVTYGQNEGPPPPAGVVGSGQSAGGSLAVRNAALVDVALAWEWLGSEAEEVEGFVDEEIVWVAVLGAESWGESAGTVGLPPAAIEDGERGADLETADQTKNDEAWLADALLERVFG